MINSDTLLKAERSIAMEINTIVDMITNQGIGIACVIYLIYDRMHASKIQEEAAKEQSLALKEISTTLIKLNERINNLELCKTNKEK
jgi:uridine phosphorylase